MGTKKLSFFKMAKKEIVQTKVMLFFLIAFMFFLTMYFIFRDLLDWIPLILPEFLGIALLGIIITFALKKTTRMTKFLGITFGIFMIGLVGFVIGRAYDIRFLVDLMPELLGSTGLGIVISIIFKEKMML